jgi:4-aminobutyrate aminotransferase/(S)-3-amino-2-methylpropionate transaminase
VSKTIDLKTEIPGPKSRALLERRSRAVPEGVYHTVPVFAQSAKGATLTDADGNRYIDFAGGIGVLNAGSANERVTEAVAAQARRFLPTCFHVVMYEPYVAVAEKLAEVTPGEGSSCRPREARPGPRDERARRSRDLRGDPALLRARRDHGSRPAC